MKRLLILAGLLMVLPAFSAPEKKVAPRWLEITHERFFELQCALHEVAYPISSQALIVKLGLKGSAAWLGVHSRPPTGAYRHFEHFAISDPAAPGGCYELEFELKEIIGDDTKNQVIRARLCFVTTAGITFYADELEPPGAKAKPSLA